MKSLSEYLPLFRRPFTLTALLAAGGLTLFAGVGCEDDNAELDVDTRLNGQVMPVAFQEAQGGQGQRTAESEGELTIRKTMPERIVMGQQMTYTIELANAAGGDLSGLIVREELPEGFEFVEANPQPTSQEGRTLVFRYGHVEADQSGQIQITGTPQQVGDLQACTTYEFDRGVCAAFTVVNPQLRLEKRLAGEGPFSVCTPVEITYILSNDGDNAAQDVTVYDQLPEGMMLAEGEGRTVEFEVGNVDPGQTIERTVQVKAEQAREYSSYAYAESNLDEVRSKSVAAQFVAPDIQVQARSTDPFVYVGTQARFEVTVTNRGDVPAQRTILATAAGGGELAGVYGGQQQEGQAQVAGAREVGDGDLVLGTLQPGESRTVFVDVEPQQQGNVELGAVAQAVCADSGAELARAQSTANVEIRTIPALHTTVVDKVDPVRVGDQTTYEINVINEGSADDSNLQLSAQLPEGASFVSAEGPTEVNADGNNLNFGALDSLPQGQRATWYVTVKADEAVGSTQFRVNVKSQAFPEGTEADEPTRLY